MKKLMLLTAVLAGMTVVNGCRSPELAGRQFTQEEEDFQQYIKQSYPGWEAPKPLPNGVRASNINADNADMMVVEDIEIDDNDVSEKPQRAYSEYVIQKGDSLSRIAKKVYGDGRKYYQIQRANPELLKNPNNLKLGAKLRIPAL